MKYWKSLIKMAFAAGLIFILHGRVNATTVVVKTPPPAVKVVIKPKAPYAKAVWIPGHWAWYRGKYTWIDGYWIKHHPGYVYVPGRWIKRPGGWVWVRGHWKRV